MASSRTVNQAGNAAALTDHDFASLCEEYKTYIERLKAKWLRENNHPPGVWTLYELDPEEQRRVHGVNHRWGQYITPIAESWWQQRGYGIEWPKKSSDPCRYYRLEDA